MGASAFERMRENKNWAAAGEPHPDARFLCTCRECRVTLQPPSNKTIRKLPDAFAALIMKFVCSTVHRNSSERLRLKTGTETSYSWRATPFCIETRHVEAFTLDISRSLAFVARA